MAINRFSQLQQPARFNPLSYEEMSVAPLALREREDQLQNANDEILSKLNNIVVPDIYQESFDTQRNQLETRLTELSEKINKEGAGNLNLLGEFRNLRNEYNTSTSANGMIGRMAGAQENINTVKDAYFKDAMAKGLPPEQIKRNWELEVNNYKQGLPTDLSKFKGQLPEFTPNYAPPKVDLNSQAQKLSTMLGKVEESIGEFQTIPNYDPNDSSKILNYTIVNNQGTEIKNNEQVDALKSYMQRNILDPNSEVNQYIRWTGASTEDYLANVQDLTNMMRSSSTNVTSKYAGQTPASPTTTTGRGRSNAGAGSTTPGEATLVSANTGYKKIVNTQTPDAIRGAIESIKNDKKEGAISEAEANEQLSVYNQALRVKQNMVESEAFQTAINNNIKSNKTLTDLGITNQQQYEAYINNPNNDDSREPVYIPSPSMGGQGQWVTPPNNMDAAVNEYNKIYSNLPNELISDNNYYTFGPNKADTDLAKIMGNGAQNINLRDMANRGALSIVSPDDERAQFSQVANTSDEKFNAMMDRIETAKDVEYTLQGIDDGGFAGKPAIVYNVKVKGDKTATNYSMAIDLDNDDFSRSLLTGDLYNSLDRQSQIHLDHIQDKINYRGLPTNLDIQEPFTESNTQAIKQYSTQRNNELGIFPRSGDDPYNDNLFVNPNDTRNNYSVIVNEDSSYSMYKKEKNNPSASAEPMTFEDYAKQQSFVASLNNPSSNTSPEAYKIDLMDTLLATTGNFDKPTSTSVLYNDSKIYQDTLNEYFLFTRNNNNTLARQQKAIELYDNISNLRIFSKTMKSIL